MKIDYLVSKSPPSGSCKPSICLKTPFSPTLSTTYLLISYDYLYWINYWPSVYLSHEIHQRKRQRPITEIFSLEQAIDANNEVRLIDVFVKSIDLEQDFCVLAPLRKQSKRFSGL
jgi:hypothetical protein